MSAVATISSLIPLLMVAAMRRAEARIHRRLAEAGAVSAESAIQLSLSRSFDRRRLQGLIGGGAVRLTADSRYFLDADGWTRYQGNRRRRALLAMSIIAVFVGVGIAVFFVLR